MTQATTGPDERSKFSRVMSAIVVALGGVVWLLPLWLMLWIVPRFEDIFRKFDIKGGLPALTMLEIDLSHFLANFWYPIVPACVLAAAALAVWCYRTPSRRGVHVARCFLAASLAAVIVDVIFLVVGMFLPLVHLIRAVGARGGS
jgi:type II secretory pathway component PulF